VDNKVIGGAITALGVLGALLGLYLFDFGAGELHIKRLIAALVLGAIFVAVGIFVAMRPTKAAA